MRAWPASVTRRMARRPPEATTAPTPIGCPTPNPEPPIGRMVGIEQIDANPYQPRQVIRLPDDDALRLFEWRQVFRWMFSIRAISMTSLSSDSRMTIGTSRRPTCTAA